MNDDLRGRVALLTGAAGGIGGALARRLIDAGVRLGLAYGRNAGPAEELAGLAREAGVDALTVQGDLSDPAVPARLVAAVRDALGPVDLLINNAGVALPRSGYPDVSLADWDHTQAVNLRAPFLLTQLAAPVMAERGFGRILYISSVAAFTGGIVGPHYAASKAGLHGLVHYFAGRLATSGVTANAIAPALIGETGMIPGGGSPPLPVPVGRLGRPTEVADLAMAFLRNGYLTGQVTLLDGGLHPR